MDLLTAYRCVAKKLPMSVYMGPKGNIVVKSVLRVRPLTVIAK